MLKTEDMLEKLIDISTFEVKWEEVWKLSEFNALRNTHQNPLWHMEDLVSIHTMNVVDEMRKQLTDESDSRKLALVAAALFHDIGKGVTTVWDDEKGSWTSPRHAIVGEQITRRMLWNEDTHLREYICSMVRNHMKPLYVRESQKPVREVIKLAEDTYPLSDLLKLKTADCRGSKQQNEDDWYEQLCNVRSVAEKYGCLDAPYAFANEYSRYHYFNLCEDNEPSELHSESDFTVYFMIGIPGSGKDTYIRNNLGGLPTVCRDDIRTNIGLKGEKPFGNKEQEEQVTKIQNDMILRYCGEHQSFVINATNLKVKYRGEFKKMIAPHNPRVVYVYVEAPSFERTLERRKGMIEPNIIRRMRDGIEFPKRWEAYEIVYDLQTEDGHETDGERD